MGGAGKQSLKSRRIVSVHLGSRQSLTESYAVKVSPGLCSHLEVQLVKNPLPPSLRWLAEFSFLVVVGLMAMPLAHH